MHFIYIKVIKIIKKHKRGSTLVHGKYTNESPIKIKEQSRNKNTIITN